MARRGTEVAKSGLDGAAKSGALARGLRVLVAVNDLENGTVAALVDETGLAKATVIRLLQTLVTEGYVARHDGVAAYSVTAKVASLARALTSKTLADATIQEILDRFAEEIKWPTEFLVPDGHSMVVRTHSREKAPIKLRRFDRRRFAMVDSGGGVAYLAGLPAGERQALFGNSGLSGKALAAAKARVRAATKAGYAVRAYPELAANLRVFSVALPGGKGALSVPHFDDVLTEPVAVAEILPRLREVAAEIAALLE